MDDPCSEWPTIHHAARIGNERATAFIGIGMFILKGAANVLLVKTVVTSFMDQPRC